MNDTVRPVAYFCTEFALANNIPTYAGGLGVLAGDFIREASDEHFSMVAVGLYYHEGYVCQKLDENDNIVESSVVITKPQDVGLTPVVDQEGQPIKITIPIQDRQVVVQGWKWQQGNVPVYLLDTNVSENAPSDQQITNRLYDPDKETRLKQEMILGIGGVRFLEKLAIHPIIYHLNEGHSAMLALDLIRHEMDERQLPFEKAKELISDHIVFTNHTLVPAGDELYSNDLASALLSGYAEELKIPVADIVALGLVQESSIFSMTMLSLRLSGRINTVSALHQKKASTLWTDHPMTFVTNGIHIPSWDMIGQADLWEKHQENKRQLLTRIKSSSDIKWKENELLLGWARRMVAYKRPLAILEDLERFLALAKNPNRPVRIVFAGQAPPGDTNAGELLQKLQAIIKTKLSNVAIYILDYDLEVAQLLVSGCDVWLNTPVVGFEACGTSGMKAALNGVLPMTTKDGWVDEVELFGIGWILDSDMIYKNILDVLENQIIPMYYALDANGIPTEWVRHMKNGRELILNELSAAKMLHSYKEKMYAPAISSLYIKS